MATTKEMNDFIQAVVDLRGVSSSSAMAFALGYVTEYVPAEELTKAIRVMKEGI